MMVVSKVFISTLLLLVLAKINSAGLMNNSVIGYSSEECSCRGLLGDFCGGHPEALKGKCDEKTLYNCDDEDGPTTIVSKCDKQCEIKVDLGIDECSEDCECGKWIGTICGTRRNEHPAALFGKCELKGYYNCKSNGGLADLKGLCKICKKGPQAGLDECSESF